uniref:Uncharacterized protein n=1 Tax=Sphaerodactylus townsendi TaxID=933632 RepID=A0ACB8E4Y1_9SAUR
MTQLTGSQRHKLLVPQKTNSDTQAGWRPLRFCIHLSQRKRKFGLRRQFLTTHEWTDHPFQSLGGKSKATAFGKGTACGILLWQGKERRIITRQERRGISWGETPSTSSNIPKRCPYQGPDHSLICST